MKSFTFYSYKGGTGRSLATAQLAVILARAGKSVCALDFDIEAPGLHHKFGREAVPKVDKGLVDYIDDYVRSQGKIMEPIDSKLSKIHVGEKGHIYLFSAGNILGSDNKYWRTISERNWHEFMAFLHESLDAGSFFSRLENKIKGEFKPSPEYLLIDSRSGVNELAGICTRLLAEEVIFLTANHYEGFEGTRLILDSFEKAREKGEKAPIKSHLVLSRIPQYYFGSLKENEEENRFNWFSVEDLENVKSNALKIINFGLEKKFNAIYPFRSEPRIGVDEKLVIGFTGSAMSSPLSKDYIDFFKVLVPEIRLELDALLKDVTIFRPYLLVEKVGKIINPEDDEWNVAFRVETFLGTFSTFYEDTFRREEEHFYAKEKEKGAEENVAKETAKKKAERIASEVLFKAGKKAAQNFSVYLKDHWEKEKEKYKKTLSFKTKLDEWCKFDSTVGFGKFENITWGEAKEGEINLINNFLIYKRNKSDHNLCGFMKGYIASILNVIFSSESITITHDLDKDCGQYKDTDPKVCTFHFKVDAQ